MAEDDTPCWYAVRTATRQEHKTVAALHEMRQEHALTADFYLPCETRWGPYKRDGKTRDPKQVPLLVGYLFVHMRPRDVWHTEEVRGVYRVLDHVRDDGRRVATEIPARFIEKLRDAELSGKFDRTRGKSRATGAERVTWTKLADLATMTEEDRLRALASYLGLKIEPEAEPEPDYSAAMDERRAA